MAGNEMMAGNSGDEGQTAGNPSLIRHLTARRSVTAAALGEPGPDRGTLVDMLTIAARVPDHKKLAPWRFIVIEGEARAAFGERLAQIWAEKEPEASSVKLETEGTRFSRVPVVVAVISSPKPHPACPEWEQVLSAGAACFNLLHAANAHGFGAQWITEWYGFDENVAAAFGLADGERFAGFVYIGTPQEQPKERDRPEIAAITQFPTGPVGA